MIRHDGAVALTDAMALKISIAGHTGAARLLCVTAADTPQSPFHSHVTAFMPATAPHPGYLRVLLLLPILLLGACGDSARQEVDTAASAAAQPEAGAGGKLPATLAVTGARIWTGDSHAPWAEALAARGDEIIAIGSTAAILDLVDADTRTLEADGRLVVPGFIDSHVHFLWGGDGLASVQLRDASTPQEFSERIASFAQGIEPGTWLLNGTWDHENWGGELPHRDWIDPVTTDTPVWVTRLDGHMALANSAAMALAGVSADTEDVPGGSIVRDPDGTPTGIFKDNAMDLIAAAVPAPAPQQLDAMVDAAMRHLAEHGVTTVHDMGDWDSIAAYRRAHSEGRMTARIYAFVPLNQWQRLADEVDERGRGDRWLTIGGLKGFMDGSLGSHTAAFFEPFSDAPDDRGLLVNDPADVEQWVRQADARGLQVAVHAIGDRAISMLLDIYARVADAHGPRDRRFRIEHAQHIAPDDIARFAALDVTASMQPYHAIDDGRWADKVIGAERARTTYAFAGLLDADAQVAFGSDWPVAPPTPLEGIYAAVTRATLDGAHPEGWVPEQKIAVEQALQAYTRGAARAGFSEARLGSLEVGKLADFVMLDRDITRMDAAGIREARVQTTVVGGEIVYAAP
jgi:predicted amidohydrolase YtcJ